MQDGCSVQLVGPEPECARTEHVTGSAGFLTKGSCGSGPPFNSTLIRPWGPSASFF